MEQMKHFLKQQWMLVGIVFVGLVLRVLFLGRIPVSLTGDELVYIFNAKLFLLGSSALQGWNPFLAFVFHYPPGTFPQAELPYLIALLTSFSSTLFAIRLPYSLMSVGIIIVLYFLGKELFDKKAGYVIALTAALNPWLIVMGRTAYEMTPATLCYLLGIYFYLKAKKVNGYILSFLFFLLGFYSYIGTKLIFLPLIITTALFVYGKHKTQKKIHITFSIAALGIVLISFLFLHFQPNSRLGEIFLPTNPNIAKEVMSIRQASLPIPFEKILVNKFTVYVSILSTKAIAALSLGDLFSHGDLFYGLGGTGLFYSIDLVFFLLGLLFIGRKEIRSGLYLACLLGIGLLPQIFYKETNLFTPHISFIVPVIIIVIGCGISAISDFISYKKLIITCLTLGYMYVVSQFFVTYFFQYPTNSQSDFPTHLLSSYLMRVDKSTSVTVYSNHSEDIYKKYLTYQGLLNQQTISQVDVSLQKKKYDIENVHFVSCDTTAQTEKVKGIVVIQSQCGSVITQEAFHKISLLLDGGEVYRIYHDTVCSLYELPTYPAKNSLQEFAVENLSNTSYCQTFISK
jgi:4-amino-4-deoxy-L-arabinose transferase-like glycosyltransferase